MAIYPCVGTDTLTVCRKIVGAIINIVTFVNKTKELLCLGVTLRRYTIRENLRVPNVASF